MAEDKRNAFLGTEVSEPVPGKDTLNRHDEIVTVRGNGPEKVLPD